MSNYRELLKQREALQRQIDTAYEQELASAIAKVQEIINEYSLTPEQVFVQPNAKRGRKPGVKPARYRDPVSGATWSGMGRQPLWIKGQSREQFSIES